MPRQLTPRQARRVAASSRVARLLDSAVRVPGTSYRFGLDPIVGLVPGFGDLVAPLFTILLLIQARELNLPRVVQLRMLINAGLDALVGMVPLIGDLFDFAWKANRKNMALLERHAYQERSASPGDWLFAAVMILLALAVAAVPFLLGATLIRLVLGVWS